MELDIITRVKGVMKTSVSSCYIRVPTGTVRKNWNKLSSYARLNFTISDVILLDKPVALVLDKFALGGVIF